jgi:cytoskeletal protein CcmA (bactofilin family)
MLEVEGRPKNTQHFTGSDEKQTGDAASQPFPDAEFDPAAIFDRWLADVQANEQQRSNGATHNEEIFFESARGSKCEVNFEGVLHFDGYTLGNIRSPDGTLVLAKEGRVDADIDVGRAVISGAVTGNIIAPGGVVLDSDARVTGQIHTRMLSVRVGAMFEGDCLFVAAPESPDLAESSGVEWLNKR